MKDDLSLFSEANEEDVQQEVLNQQLQKSMSELIATRNSAMQKYAQVTVAAAPEE